MEIKFCQNYSSANEENSPEFIKAYGITTKAFVSILP
jgi:hypothetical protein